MPNNEINMDVQGQGSASVSMNPSVDDAAFVGRAEAWAVGKRNGTDVPSTDPAYHNNAKYYATEAAASAADAQQYTAAAVHTWLENNVDPETGYVLDRTLSEKLAAAPADMVGDLKSAINLNDGNEIIKFTIGKQITTSGSTVDPTNLITNANAKCAVVSCTEGDVFVINGKGGNGARLWCFCNSSNAVVKVSDANATLTDAKIIAPANSSYLVVNITSNADQGVVIKGLSVDKRFDDIEFYVNKAKSIHIEEQNSYSENNHYFDCENFPGVVYNVSSGNLTKAENVAYGYSAKILVADYDHDINVRFSDAVNKYWKLRVLVVDGISVVISSTVNREDDRIFKIPASTMKTWADNNYDYVMFTVLNYNDSNYSTTKDLPINTFVEAYYKDNEDVTPQADETDYIRVLKVAELPYNKTYDLFVFSGQSNMMGASAIPPTDDAKCYFAYEYIFNPKRKGGQTGQFVNTKHSAGEWSYKDMETAYAPGNVDSHGRSKTAYYNTNTYFISSMANRSGEGTVAAFNSYSESTAQIGQSIPPFFANEYASHGCPCVYAQMAKGGVSIDYYFDTNVKAFFEAKFASMLSDFPVLMTDCSIRSKNFVWCQGESDTSYTKAQYKEKLATLWTWLQTLGFENFFCIRVGYFGSTNITRIMAAQEEFCAENDHCYIVTRAMSYMPYPGMNESTFYVTTPTDEYRLCRDSYLGYENDHINTKGDKLVAKRAASNIFRILNNGESPVLEEENVTALTT